MSNTRKGYRWSEPDRANTVELTDTLTGAIWEQAPRDTLILGRKRVFAPDLGVLYDFGSGTPGTKRAAGSASTSVVFGGGYWANLNLTSAGAGNEAITTPGGRLQIVTDAADNDFVCFLFNGGAATGCLATMPFTPLAGTVIRCGIRAKLSDVAQEDFLFGLVTAAAVDPVGTPPDGIYIRKDDGDTQPDLVLNSTAEDVKALTLETGGAVIALANTYFEAGFVIEGVSRVIAYWNGHRTVQSDVSDLSTAALCPVFQIQNGDANARTLMVEKFVITQEIQ